MTPASVFDLDGKVAVVTGAASGIGEATAKVLAAAGASVVAADVDEGGAAKTADAISSEGGTAIGVGCNVTSRAEVDATVDAAVDSYGRLDAMCNIAGIPLDRLIAEATEDELDRIIAVNLKGVFFGCQAAIRVMTEQQSGSIVNVTSSGIDAPAKGYGLYAMTKAGVAMLTKSLAVEAGPIGIRVNAVAPGATITPFTERHLYGPDGKLQTEYYDRFVEAMRKQSPLGIVGDPVDQAYLIQYLVSDAARFCTGAIWRANGGQTFSW
ncbi:MAG: SDR family NAD(P)-dependent oxidoreductase [Actinomycetota bacterium]